MIAYLFQTLVKPDLSNFFTLLKKINHTLNWIYISLFLLLKKYKED